MNIDWQGWLKSYLVHSFHTLYKHNKDHHSTSKFLFAKILILIRCNMNSDTAAQLATLCQSSPPPCIATHCQLTTVAELRCVSVIHRIESRPMRAEHLRGLDWPWPEKGRLVKPCWAKTWANATYRSREDRFLLQDMWLVTCYQVFTLIGWNWKAHSPEPSLASTFIMILFVHLRFCSSATANQSIYSDKGNNINRFSKKMNESDSFWALTKFLYKFSS